ncbi:uncharacterized protein [Euwallacea fornicatus]|uniref:uncharacterized protein n=1 Tax=Euwallacea fornicatus TaxID=995702 RepID=UPI00338F9BA3
MKLAILLLTLTFTIHVSRANYLNQQPVAVAERARCGDFLNKLLSEMCGNVFAGPPPHKKSVIPVGFSNMLQDEYESSPDAMDDLYALYLNAMWRYGSHGRRKRFDGIVEECCLQTCSREQLREYCGIRRQGR